MNTHADKTQENKSPSVANAVAQKKSSIESTFQFVDNRPEAAAQRKLQEMANVSPQLSPLKAFQDMANNSPQVKQAAQLQAMADNHSTKYQQPIQKKENNISSPDENSNPSLETTAKNSHNESVMQLVSLGGLVDYKSDPEGEEVEMSEIKVSNGAMYSTGFAPCIAIVAEGTNGEGETNKAFWHYDSTQANGGETAVSEITEALAGPEGGEVNELSTVAVRGKDDSSNWGIISGDVDESAVPDNPVGGADWADVWWDVEVYLESDGTVNYSTPTDEDYHPAGEGSNPGTTT